MDRQPYVTLYIQLLIQSFEMEKLPFGGGGYIFLRSFTLRILVFVQEHKDVHIFLCYSYVLHVFPASALVVVL